MLERGGCPLHYWVHGEAGRPAVVLVHGLLMDHRLFDAQVPALAAAYRVIVVDVRGHGQSRPIGAGGFSIAGCAADLAAVLDEAGVRRAALVGHSMGGFIVQELAFREPGRVAALAVFSSTSLFGRPPFVAAPVGRLAELGMRTVPDPVLRLLVGYGAGDDPRVRRYAVSASRKVPRGDVDRLWRGIIRGFRRVRGYRLPGPLLLVHGERDFRVGFGLIPLLARGWARREGCERVVVRRAGHNCNQDNPAEFNRALLGFLGRHL